jgi:hypothetical protein
MKKRWGETGRRNTKTDGHLLYCARNRPCGLKRLPLTAADDVDADHRMGTVELFGWLEATAVDMQRRNKQFGRKMRGERIGHTEFDREHDTEIARSENPERHFRSCRRRRLDALIRTGRSEECLYFEIRTGGPACDGPREGSRPPRG